MIRVSSLISSSRSVQRTLALLLTGGFALSTVFAAELSGEIEATNEAENLAQLNCGAQIECIMPDGRLATIGARTAQNANPTALIMDDDTISCPLQGGDTDRKSTRLNLQS